MSYPTEDEINSFDSQVKEAINDGHFDADVKARWFAMCAVKFIEGRLRITTPMGQTIFPKVDGYMGKGNYRYRAGDTVFLVNVNKKVILDART